MPCSLGTRTEHLCANIIVVVLIMGTCDDQVGGGFELLVVICSDQFCHLKAVLHDWWQQECKNDEA